MRIRIDLNRRTYGGYVPAEYHGIDPEVGQQIIVFEPEDGVEADAVIRSVDAEDRFIEVRVDWDSVREMER